MTHDSDGVAWLSDQVAKLSQMSEEVAKVPMLSEEVAKLPEVCDEVKEHVEQEVSRMNKQVKDVVSRLEKQVTEEVSRLEQVLILEKDEYLERLVYAGQQLALRQDLMFGKVEQGVERAVREWEGLMFESLEQNVERTVEGLRKEMNLGRRSSLVERGAIAKVRDSSGLDGVWQSGVFGGDNSDNLALIT